MSLNVALGLSLAGIRASQSEIATTTQNITNAGVEGYTKKTYQSNLLTSGSAIFPAGGQNIRITNAFLEKELIGDVSVAFRDVVLSESLTRYQQSLGTTGGNNSISAFLNDLNARFVSLSSDPDDVNVKYGIVQQANLAANNIRESEARIQELRQDADDKINLSIAEINESIEAIYNFNRRISEFQNSNSGDSTNFEDQRFQELQKLSEKMDVGYFYTDDNELRLFSKSGVTLVGATTFQQYDFIPTPSLSQDASYPLTLNGITLNGTDVTTDFDAGEIAGYIELRDSIYVEEQEKLNELANQLRDQINTITNQGTALPARSSFVGDTENLTLATPVATAGIARVAVVDDAGVVQELADLNVGGAATVGDLITLLNGMAGVTAALNVDGALEINTVNPDFGISFNESSSSVDGLGFSHFFGLNNLFNGTDSRDIRVPDYLLDDASLFTSNFLSNDPLLAVGDTGIAGADNTIVLALIDQMSTDVTSFNAAGNFAAQTNSLIEYGSAFVANAASRAANAEISANITTTSFDTVQNLLQNETGVNVDEETARLLVLENNYESAALIIQTVRDLFDALLAAVR